MNRILWTLALLALSGMNLWAQTPSAPAPNAALRARPVQIVSCAPMPAEIGFELKPMGYDPGFEIFYLVEGSHIAGIQDDSLVMAGIRTPAGEELSKNRMGMPTCQLGPFPKVSDDGKYALFSVKVQQDQFGKVESLAMKGSVTMQIASRREEKTVEMAASDSEPRRAGPFSVAVAAEDAGGMADMFGGGGFGIRIPGPLEQIIDVTLAAAGAKEKSTSNMSDGSSTTYFFEKPAAEAFTVQIACWADLSEQKVVFGQRGAAAP